MKVNLPSLVVVAAYPSSVERECRRTLAEATGLPASSRSTPVQEFPAVANALGINSKPRTNIPAQSRREEWDMVTDYINRRAGSCASCHTLRTMVWKHSTGVGARVDRFASAEVVAP